MKKVFGFILFVVICLCGCASEQGNNDEKINICATIFPQYDFARSIAGDLAQVSMLLPPGGESHTYEPTPKDIMTIHKSDIFIYTGGKSDNWIDEILKTIDTKDMKILRLMDICGENSEQTHQHAVDEHVWTSPKNAVLICDAIFDALVEIDKENEEIYTNRYMQYKNELLALDAELLQIVDNAKRKTVVFADRFPFAHFIKAYGLDYYSPFTGCQEESEASIASVAQLIDKVKDEKIPVVFHIEFSNCTLADTVSEETGAKPLLLHSCHSVSKEELEVGVTYIEIMKRNVQALREALY